MEEVYVLIEELSGREPRTHVVAVATNPRALDRLISQLAPSAKWEQLSPWDWVTYTEAYPASIYRLHVRLITITELTHGRHPSLGGPG